MGNREQESQSDDPQEIFDPHHFYAAYVFDRVNEREFDIGMVLNRASELGYPVRYWWLSEAMELQGFPDRLIVCVHHSSGSENAGMDVYESLSEKGASWDDLEAAAVDEYRYLGKPVEELVDLRLPYGNILFPDTRAENEKALFIITPEDVRDEAESRLGRDLTEEEFSSILVKFKKSLDWMYWAFYLDEIIRLCQEAGPVGPDAEDPNEFTQKVES
jgi:hypothetical protein